MRTTTAEQIRVDIAQETQMGLIPRRDEGPALENLLEYLSDYECLTLLRWAKRCVPQLLRRLMVSYFERQTQSVTLEAAEREHISRVLSESKTLTGPQRDSASTAPRSGVSASCTTLNSLSPLLTCL